MLLHSGCQSVTIDDLLARIDALGGKVILVNGAPRLRGLSKAAAAEVLDELREHRDELAEHLTVKRCKWCGREWHKALTYCLGVEDGPACEWE
jgi:predicted transcriptional regulator